MFFCQLDQKKFAMCRWRQKTERALRGGRGPMADRKLAARATLPCARPRHRDYRVVPMMLCWYP